MDVMSDLLNSVRLQASSYFCSEFSSPWGMDIPDVKNGVFHAVIRGQAWLHLRGYDSPIPLTAGDIVAFPGGVTHCISDQPNGAALPGPWVIDEIVSGRNPFKAEGISTTLLCGHFDYDQSVSHPLLEELPPYIHITTTEQMELTWLWQLITNIGRESRSSEPGAATIADRLTEVLIIQLFRIALTSDQYDSGFLKALSDDYVGRALQLMHESPEHSWTVERLAERVGLSRTGFNSRFRDKIGLPPLSYLTNWRMEIARKRLLESDNSLLSIAEQVGYSSEAAFSKAFTKHFQVGPGKMRREYVKAI